MLSTSSPFFAGLAAPALLLTACASSTGPADGSRSDAAVDASLDPAVVVVVGPFLPTTPGAGFAVHVEASNGAVTESTTDGTGHAPLALDPGTGPWRITVARAGYTAVSIFGVTGSLGAPILVYPLDAQPPTFQPPPAAATASIHGTFVNAPGHAGALTVVGPDLELVPATGDGAVVSDGMGSYTAMLERQQMATSISAIAWDYLGGRRFPLAAITDAGVSTSSADIPLDFDFASMSSTPTIVTFPFALPSTGIFTQGSVLPGGSMNAALRLWPDVVRGWAEVGKSATISQPDGSLVAELHYFPNDPNLTPDFAIEDVYFRVGGATQQVSLQVRQFVDGMSLQVPPVDALRVGAGASTLDDVVLTAHADAYDAAGFDVGAGAWQGYTYSNATLDGQHLPHLPNGITLHDLGVESPASVEPRLYRRRAGSSTPPWAQDYFRDAGEVFVSGGGQSVPTTNW